jgi:hypothetical protein
MAEGKIPPNLGAGYGGGAHWKDRDFVCRVCGGTDFYRLKAKGVDGRERETAVWRCGRCSVLFESWRDFTKAP